MSIDDRASFFSVAFNLVLVGEKVPYDLYINSSGNVKKDRFVRIFPTDGVLKEDDLKDFKKKYYQLYVLESQRHLYLKSLIKRDDIPDIEKSVVIKDSAIHYLSTVFDSDKEFTTELLSETIEGCKESVESMIEVMKDYSVHDIQDLIASLSFHDFYTYDHSINVSMYAISIYKAYKPEASKDELLHAGLGGLLHDLGKIKIPTNIINKPDGLSDEDFKVIQKHPEYGKELLEKEGCSCQGVDLSIIKRVTFEHHENFNGQGYPNKIAGEDIHLLARIVAIADFFDALTTKRSYHEVLTTDEALAVMARTIGKKIDPKLFDLFVYSVNKLFDKKVSARELDENFDPCQPHKNLPLQQAKAAIIDDNITKKEEKDFGKVSTPRSLFDFIKKRR